MTVRPTTRRRKNGKALHPRYGEHSDCPKCFQPGIEYYFRDGHDPSKIYLEYTHRDIILGRRKDKDGKDRGLRYKRCYIGRVMSTQEAIYGMKPSPDVRTDRYLSDSSVSLEDDIRQLAKSFRKRGKNSVARYHYVAALLEALLQRQRRQER